MLLVVQQLLYRTPNDDGVQVTAAALLESAIEHSPDNSYLKMAAIHVYHNLNAISRSWELFQQMGIKHIQLDTCNFIILPLLMEGGLYNEAIDVSNALLRFQANTARDCGDYAGRAMEGAVLSKANEFMVFQRSKMNKSLTVLEAKGTILDAASLLATAVPRKKHDDDPIWKGGLGINHGIVGGEEDMSRATQMVAETNNPYAALSVVSWAANGGSVIDCEDLADNRDLSVYHYQILYKMPPPSKSQLAVDALRRGHVHCMLIRATLCLDATKGPKKGKVVKPTAQLEKRTESLLDCVAGIEEFVGQCTLAEGSNGECYKAMLLASVELCRVLSVINTGLPNLDQNDILELREQRATEILQGPVLEQLKLAHVSCVPSVKSICSTTPNFLVPLFAIFKMCGRLCNTYGWGVRKRKTKRCAEAMAAAAGMLNAIIDKMLTEMKRYVLIGCLSNIIRKSCSKCRLLQFRKLPTVCQNPTREPPLELVWTGRVTSPTLSISRGSNQQWSWWYELRLEQGPESNQFSNKWMNIWTLLTLQMIKMIQNRNTPSLGIRSIVRKPLSSCRSSAFSCCLRDMVSSERCSPS